MELKDQVRQKMKTNGGIFFHAWHAFMQGDQVYWSCSEGCCDGEYDFETYDDPFEAFWEAWGDIIERDGYS